MFYKAFYKKHELNFKFNAGTSRGTMKTRIVWYLVIEHISINIYGVGEVAPLPGLSIESVSDIEKYLDILCTIINTSVEQDLSFILGKEEILKLPSVYFALETALLDLQSGGKRLIFNNNFSNGSAAIPINGLVWMGTEEFMKIQILAKIEEGYKCIKIKVGAIEFSKEIKLLEFIRKEFSSEIIIRLDANGAFHPSEALSRLKDLSVFDIHSIEQPIQQGLLKDMEILCRKSPIPIALDEELIGIESFERKLELLQFIQPHYIILKPSLLGGFKACDDWIHISNQYNIGWWITSALESNIGLNAICQYAFQKNAAGFQGFGTGKLYDNNVGSPLFISEGNIGFNTKSSWDLSNLEL